LRESELPEAGARQGDSPALRRLGDFDLLRELGRGGMGVVYEARQISLNRRVALKVLPPGLGLTPQAVQRFEREAQAAAKLHHTNIVPVHAIGEEESCHYYAMELIEGQSLSEVLYDLSGTGSNPLMDKTLTQLGEGEVAEPEPDVTTSTPSITSLSDSSAGSRKWFDAVAKLISEVADALHYAHGRGVIHRDIKPANLMLSGDGKLCITDFGLARVAQEPGMTVSGSLMGTPAYMSPEQVASGRMKLDHRTDVYSLGAVLYEMLCQRRPFPGESREEILGGILTKDPRPPRRFNPRIPLDLETICLKAMEKDPDRRYASAGEFAEDLRQYLQHGLIKARRAGIARRTWKSIRRHPVAATVAVGVLIVVAASVVAWQWGGRGEEAQRLLADARLALTEGAYRHGLQLIERAVKLTPDSFDARLVRAKLLIMDDRYQEAANEAHSVLKTDPQNYEAHAALAALALNPLYHNRLVSIDPEPHLRIVEASAPESAEAHYLQALSTKDARRRIELLDRALDLNPSDALASLARMVALQHLLDFELILSEADRMIIARPKSAEGWRLKAVAYREQRDFENARRAIDRAMEIDDRSPKNYHSRAITRWELGEHDGSISDVTRAIELGPTNAVWYSERARLLNVMGRFEEAAADGRRSIELNPDNPRGFLQLLSSYLSLEQEADVLATFQELRVRAEGWFDIEAKASAYQMIAACYTQLKDYDRAMESAERAIEIDPDDPSGFILRKNIHSTQGNDAAAEADCDAVARIELDEPGDLSSRGRSLMFDCNDPARAIEDFNQVIELVPRWYVGYFQRGTANSNLKRYDEALADLNKAIELAPYNSVTYSNRANVYRHQGWIKEELADREKSRDLNPHHVLAWVNYGGALREQGRVNEALAALDKAVELAPLSSSAHWSRAHILAWLGRCGEAASEFRRAEELAPALSSTIIANAHLSAYYYNCPEYYDLTEALRHARSSYDVKTEQTRWNLADALFRNGDYAEAMRIYFVLFEEAPDGSAWFPLAMCLWHLSEKAEAREFYDRAAAWMDERQPHNPMLIRQRQEAAALLGIQP
jgi:serine/threonine protein kinase/Flp pilus assembly protein TadD